MEYPLILPNSMTSRSSQSLNQKKLSKLFLDFADTTGNSFEASPQQH
eukprot:gene269-3644_t